MTYDPTQELRERASQIQRRLQHLELQAARYGSDCPPHILMDLEDAKAELRSVQEEIHGILQQKGILLCAVCRIGSLLMVEVQEKTEKSVIFKRTTRVITLCCNHCDNRLSIEIPVGSSERIDRHTKGKSSILGSFSGLKEIAGALFVDSVPFAIVAHDLFSHYGSHGNTHHGDDSDLSDPSHHGHHSNDGHQDYDDHTGDDVYFHH